MKYEPGAASAGGQSPIPAPPRALVVDDEPSLRELVAEMLQSLGVEAKAVASGDEVLACLEQGGYDLVITDLAMPRMTGWEVIAAIRERGFNVAIILASGSISNMDSSRAQELGVTLLRKPFRIAELRAVVAAAVRRGPAVAEPAGLPADRRAAHEDTGAPAFARSVARVMETMRRASQDLQTLFAAMDLVLDERQQLATRLEELQAEHESLRQAHDVLMGSHQAGTAALAELREAHQLVTRRHQDVLELLEALRDQLDRRIRDLRV